MPSGSRGYRSRLAEEVAVGDGDVDIVYDAAVDVFDDPVLDDLVLLESFDATDEPDIGPVTLEDAVDLSDTTTTPALAPNAEDSVDISDTFDDLVLANFGDGLDIGDEMGPVLQVADDTLRTSDNHTALEGTITPANTVDFPDTTTASMTDAITTEDTYLDRANPDTIQGAGGEALAKNNGILNDDKNAYLSWNLTGFVGGTVDSATIDLTAVAAGLTAIATAFEVYTHPTRPFNEGTSTWNNSEPPPGTLRQSGTFSAPASAGRITITLDATSRANMVGNYVYLRITGPDSGLNTTSTITISTKGASIPDRPHLNMDINY